MAPRPASEVNDWQTVQHDPGDWQQVASPGSQQPKSVLDHIENAAKNFWQELSNAGAGMVNMATSNPLTTLKSIGESQDALRQKAADALSRGDIVEAARHALSYAIPVVGPSIDARGDQAQQGDISGALGGAAAIGAMGAAPGGLEHPAVAPALEAAGTALRGAAKGAAKAAVEPINYGRLHIPLPAPVAGAMTGKYIAGTPGAAIGAAVPIVRGAVQGARAALADRIAAATESLANQAKVSAFDRAAQLTPEEQSFADRIIANTEPQAAVSRETPFQPRALLNAPPQAIQMPAGPDTSYVRAIPAQYAQPFTIQEPPTGGYTPRTLAQTEAAMAQKQPAPTEAPRSMYTSTGELKSPQLRAAEITSQNAANKGASIAAALDQVPGMTEVVLKNWRKIPIGRMSETQIQQGAIPGWGNILDDLKARQLIDPKMTDAQRSIPHVVESLRKLTMQRIADEMNK